jgi:hypothetical protein
MISSLIPFIITLPSLPTFCFIQIDHKKSRGIERSQSRRHTSYAKARKLPCSGKALPVDVRHMRHDPDLPFAPQAHCMNAERLEVIGD